MAIAGELAMLIADDDRLELLLPPRTGVVVWRPTNIEKTESLHAALPPESTSITTLADGKWLRNVVANPNVDMAGVATALTHGLRSL